MLDSRERTMTAAEKIPNRMLVSVCLHRARSRLGVSIGRAFTQDAVERGADESVVFETGVAGEHTKAYPSMPLRAARTPE